MSTLALCAVLLSVLRLASGFRPLPLSSRGIDSYLAVGSDTLLKEVEVGAPAKVVGFENIVPIEEAEIMTPKKSLIIDISHLLVEPRVSLGTSLLADRDKIRSGWSKALVKKCLPLTSDLINSRRSYDNLEVGYSLQQPPQVCDEYPQGRRRVDDSWLELVIPFADQESLRDSMCRPDGKTVRYGRLFELLDALAGDVAYRHCGGCQANLTIVTASVDGFCNFHPIDVLHNIKMQGYITYVGSSSIEVAIDIVQMCEGGLICDEQKVLAKTNFIMVARDGNKSLKVPGLLLANQQARDIFESGAERAKNRRVRAQQSLSVSPPRAEEVDLIHNLMLRGVGGAGVGVGGVGVGVGIGVGVEGQSMASTVFKSSQLMQSQNRNVHGKIFGGYIMRKSFEIAYVSVTLFCREDYPQLMFVDDIQFLKPINVGSVAEFSATVTYSRDSHVVVRVVAVTIDPISGLKVKTNVLNLIFKSKEPHPPTRNPTPNTGTSPTIPTTVYTIAADPMNTAADPKGSVQVGYVTHKVLPSTYDEVMLYLEGKRSLDAFLGNSCGKGRCAI